MMEFTESLQIVELRQQIDRLKKAHLFQKQAIAEEAVEQSLNILAAQEQRIKQLEKRCNNIQGL